MEELKGRKLPLAVLLGLIAFAFIFYESKTPTQNNTTTQPEKSVKQVRAWEAAEVGDEVSLKYATSTFLCADRGEASQVYMTGELVKWDTFRTGGSASEAVKKTMDAQKDAMRRLYSCFVPREGGRYRVKDKQISGTERDVFHTVAYCLLPSDKNECVWIVEDHDAYSPFQNVQRAQPVAAPDTNTQTSGNAAAPAQKSTQSDTKSVQDDPDRPLQSTKNDLETRMGRVWERDRYYLNKKIDLKYPGWRTGENKELNRMRLNPPPSKQVPVDDKLTAEEVFASRNKGEVQILGPVINVGPPGESCKDCLSAQALSESETLRYWGLLRIHRMAALTLYNNRCDKRPSDDKAEAAAIIESQFRKLPREVQDKALDHQIRAIESRKNFYDKGRLIAPGGFQWFCSRMNGDINGGYADPMFMTAREGFFPVEEH